MLTRTMFLAALLFVPGLAPAADSPDNSLTPEQIAEGWILLFDGETLFGWKPTTKADWRVEDGVIKVGEGEKGFLNTTCPFADYELLVDFRAEQGTNSGVFLRNIDLPEDPAKDCYELNIADASISPFPTGSFVKRERATGEHDITRWRTFHVTARGGEFQVRLDGELVLEYKDPSPLGRGSIGLQYNSGRVEFRNIKLRPLGTTPLLNGKDLSGWKVMPESKSKFSVTAEGLLHLDGGEGYLASDKEYADFTLQWDVRSNVAGGNSGMFFRCMPGVSKMGYECQLNNDKVAGEPTKPADCGTGGIYRRQNARRLVGEDGQWQSVTLIAAGDHFASWVNGYQVVDWTDPRKPHDNPREGRRMAAGALQIQGHAPPKPADFDFRGLRIAELPAAR